MYKFYLQDGDLNEAHLLKFLLKFILRSCCQDLRPFKYHITMVPDIARRIHGHDNAVFNDLLHRSIFILHHFDLYLFRLQTRFSDILKPIRLTLLSHAANPCI